MNTLLQAPRPVGEARATSNTQAVCEERATKPAGLRAAARRGAAAKGAYRRCCRSSTMSDSAFVAAPRICPPGARAKMGIYLCASPKNRERLFLVNPGHGRDGHATKIRPPS